jgi:thioredoxin reductase (NADPH)
MKKEIIYHNLIILGSGPAGYTSAIYASRANLKPVIICGDNQGGQLMNTTNVDNWPGDLNNLQGPDLMDRMEKHAKMFDVSIVNDTIKSVNFENNPFLLEGMKRTYSCKGLIIATGGNPRLLGLKSEELYFNKGVSTCAVCDGFFYKDKTVAVVGGGDAAVEEALYLSKIAKKVFLIHRRDTLRASKILSDKIVRKSLSKSSNINIIWNNIIKEIIGDKEKGVNSIRIENKNTKVQSSLSVNGLFIAIGHIPNSHIFKNKLDMFESGHLKINCNKERITETSMKGVFAAGDVTDSKYKQAITAAGYGCMAAIDAEKYMEEI